MMRHAPLALLAVGVALAGAGCSRSPNANFYTLEATASNGAAVIPPGPVGVSVGPVTLPESVDRPQLVVRVAPYRVEVLEMQRWAEPLKSAIPRVISRDLRRLLGWGQVSSYLERARTGTDIHVVLDIERFEALPGEAVVIDAAWRVRRGPAGEGGVRTGRAQVREPVQGSGYDAIVAAYSRALLAVSVNLAAEIRAEYAPTQPVPGKTATPP